MDNAMHCAALRRWARSIALVAAAGATIAASLPAVAANMPGVCTVVHNDYGQILVSGANVVGNQIVGIQSGAVIWLGPLPGAANSYVQFDCDGIDVGVGRNFNIRSGAAGQKVVLNNTDGNPSVIAGEIHMLPSAEIHMLTDGPGANLVPVSPPPFLTFINGNGIDVPLNGLIDAPSGMVLGGLSDWTNGESITNAGTIDGGPYLELHGRKIQGGGAFMGDEIIVSTLTVANNPVNGAHFLANSLQLHPSSIGGDVRLTLHGYGTTPQVFNIKIHGDGEVYMPSDWGPGNTTPPNNAVVPIGGSRAAGVPEPSYGGGSMIVQATGALKVAVGASGDFVFPGAIVLRAGTTLDLNAAVINQGWTITGQQFQGVFFESPNIVSPAGNVTVATNNPNWINFSTLPHRSVVSWTLTPQPNGSAMFDRADTTAPHRNTYSQTIEAAANGQCWVCLIDFTVIKVL